MWSIPEAASLAVHVTVADAAEITAPAAGPTIETLGFVASTVTVTEAGCVFPARSTAVTRIVWAPSEVPAKVYEVAVPATV